jgi:hypothetical protein
MGTPMGMADHTDDRAPENPQIVEPNRTIAFGEPGQAAAPGGEPVAAPGEESGGRPVAPPGTQEGGYEEGPPAYHEQPKK